MSQTRLPIQSDPIAGLANLAIRPEIIAEDVVVNLPIEAVEKEVVSHKSVFGVKKDKPEVNISLKIDEPVVKTRGKRGPDKKKRAKKVMSEAQLAALAKGRAASLAKRKGKAKAKKVTSATAIIEENTVMKKPQPNPKMDYQTFSSYMDQYEDSKKKKHFTTSVSPHPNKTIAEAQRPRPPQSQPNRPKCMKWTGGISSFAEHKKVKSRWNYGV